MDAEEAIKHFESYIENEYYTEKHREACRLAVSALRAQQTPLDRSSWDGCYICKRSKGLSGEILMHGAGYANIGEFDYCPNCGRPLTENARAELEKRIKGVQTDAMP